MSAISLKSITGITSITTPAGVDNQLTLHTNNTTERVKINSSGNVSIANDLDVDGHTNLDNVSIAGVTTTTGFIESVGTSGRGAKLGGLSVGYDSLYATIQPITGNLLHLNYNTGTEVRIGAANTKVNLDVNGDVYPKASGNRDLGLTGKRWRNVYGTTFIGNGDFVDIDVDGHTNLDNVNIAGVTTFAQAAGAVTVPAGGDIRIANSGGWLGEYGGKIQQYLNFLYIQGGTSGIRLRHSDGNDRWVIDSNGHFVAGADSTYDIGSNGTRVRNVYADTYYGDGSNLTGISGVTINGNVDNRLVTATGTTGTLNGEASLTFDGNDLTVGRYIYAKDIFIGDVSPELRFTDSDDNHNYQIRLNSGDLRIKDITNSADKLVFDSSGHQYFTQSVGIQTSNISAANLANPVGAGHSLIGLYIGDGSLLFSDQLARSGGYYITTGVNALNAGPVTLNSEMTLDGTWTIV